MKEEVGEFEDDLDEEKVPKETEGVKTEALDNKLRDERGRREDKQHDKSHPDAVVK